MYHKNNKCVAPIVSGDIDSIFFAVCGGDYNTLLYQVPFAANSYVKIVDCYFMERDLKLGVLYIGIL